MTERVFVWFMKTWGVCDHHLPPQVSAESPSFGAARRRERARESAWKGHKHIIVSFGTEGARL